MARKSTFRSRDFTNTRKGGSLKKQQQHTILTNQSDYYDEGASLEEMAERWVLSDIKKTLSFYYEAVQIYNRGLQCQIERDDKTTYNISYNRLTLLLRLQNDYKYVNGTINILQYVNGLSSELVQCLFPDDSLTRLLKEFDDLLQIMESNNDSEILITWDLYFNYLTGLLLYIETKNAYSVDISGSELVLICDKVVHCFKKLIDLHLVFLETVQPLIDMEQQKIDQEQQDLNLQKDLIQNETYDVTTGMGIKTMDNNIAPNNSTEYDESKTLQEPQYMDSRAGMTKETYFETLATTNSFVNTTLELMISSGSTTVNQIDSSEGFQKTYIQEMIKKLHLQIRGLLESMNLDEIPVNLQLSMKMTDYLFHFNDYDYIWEALHRNEPDNKDSILNDIDFLKNVCDVNESNNYSWEQRWNLCSKMDKLLVKAQQLVTKERSNISLGFIKDRDNEISSLTNTLSGLLISRCENEMTRLQLQQLKEKNTQEEQESVNKVTGILMKNVVMLCNNATNVAKQPCGMREYINDKLLRNNTYLEADTLKSVIEQQLKI